MLAISIGNVEIVKALLDAGANHNAKNKDGAVAIHLACQTGFTELVRLFLRLCGEVEVKDFSNNTPLVYAATHGHVSCVEYLIEKCVFILLSPQSRGWVGRDVLFFSRGILTRFLYQ